MYFIHYYISLLKPRISAGESPSLLENEQSCLFKEVHMPFLYNTTQ